MLVSLVLAASESIPVLVLPSIALSVPTHLRIKLAFRLRHVRRWRGRQRVRHRLRRQYSLPVPRWRSVEIRSFPLILRRICETILNGLRRLERHTRLSSVPRLIMTMMMMMKMMMMMMRMMVVVGRETCVPRRRRKS